MPPKRKATRASKRNQKEEPDQTQDQSQVEVEEPPKKQSRRGGRKKKEEPAEEPIGKEEEETAEPTPEPEPEVIKKADTSITKKKSITKPQLPSTTLSKPPPKPKSQPIPSSPTKRVSSISSRIPSPVKRAPSNSSRPSDLDHKKTEQNITQSFVSKNVPKLTSIIDELKTTRAEQSFDELKNSTELRFKTSDDLINSLTSQNQQLLSELESTKARLLELESNGAASSSVDNDEESYQNELILDMLEQIVGLRIHTVEDTDEALSFDCSQSGKSGVLDYKLTISKEDSSEIIYTPINEDNQNQSDLKEFLPDYFFDVLTFPIDTLQQFYHKIYRGLNK